MGLWDVGPWDIKGGSRMFAGTSLLAFVLNRRIYATAVFFGEIIFHYFKKKLYQLILGK